MKLKHYNSKNTKSSRASRATVRIRKTGLISFSKRASILLKLKAGNYIEFLQDEDNPTDWFIANSSENLGMMIRDYRKDAISRCLSSTTVVRKILESINLKHAKSASFLIAEEQILVDGERIWVIITSSAGR